jgi:hypothetical protein
MKIEGSVSRSISQRHGSADPDPHQNVMDPQHCFKLTLVTSKQEIEGRQVASLIDPRDFWVEERGHTHPHQHRRVLAQDLRTQNTN